MQNINFDDGFKTFTVNGDENRVVRFNPSDFGILTRAEETEQAFNEIGSKLESMGNTDEVSVEQIAQVLRETESDVKRQFDYMFNSSVSDVLFVGQSPIAIVNGEFLFKRILDAIMPIIVESINEEKKKAEKKMAKYTEQYK